jgi:hypothetical protein
MEEKVDCEVSEEAELSWTSTRHWYSPLSGEHVLPFWLSLAVQMGRSLQVLVVMGVEGMEAVVFVRSIIVLRMRTRTTTMARRMAAMTPTLPGRERAGERRGAARETARVMLAAAE